MITLAICGAGGRMGRAILEAASKDEAVRVAALVERPGNALVGKTLQDVPVGDSVHAAAGAADAVIDFTSPEAAVKNAAQVAAQGKALVVGTTGISGDLREEFLAAVRKIPVVLSPNMSLSANVMFDLAERAARALPSYDAEIVEIHHNMKKDAPSGTAHRLAEAVQRGKARGKFLYGRHGLTGERKPDEIGVHAVRGGDVVGDHTVLLLGNGERIELAHRVTSREAFAQGAVVAAKWLVQNKKPAGLYDMRDVLGLK